MPVLLTLITRADCCLCDDMKAVVTQVAAETGSTFEIRDVDADAELRARHGAEVPVLLIDGRKAFKYRLTATALRHRVARAQGHGVWRRLWSRLR